MSTENNTIITLTIELPNEIKVTPSTGGRQMEAIVRMEYPCAKTLQQFLAVDLRRRCENLVRQDGAKQSVYNCVVQAGKLQRLHKALNVKEAVQAERFRVIDNLIASGMTREQALELVGCTEEDLPQP